MSQLALPIQAAGSRDKVVADGIRQRQLYLSLEIMKYVNLFNMQARSIVRPCGPELRK